MTPTDGTDAPGAAPTPEPDPAWARLAGADPARDAHADTARVDAALASHLSAPAALASRRRGRTRVLVAAAAAVALVAVGAGGYAVGHRGGDDTTALPPISLQAGQDARLAAPQADTAEAGAGDVAKSSYAGWGWGRTVFQASGLSTSTGQATAYAFNTEGLYSPDKATQLAEQLGVPGTATQQEGYLEVGSTDGTGPSVSLYPDGTVSFGYYNPGADAYGCVVSDTSDASKAAQLDPSSDTDCQQRNLGKAPTAQSATEQAKEVLSALGKNPADYAFSTETWDDTSIAVTADRMLDGQALSSPWYFTYTGGGLQSLNGYLAEPASLGQYPIVSAAAALDRLSDPRFGATTTGVVPLSAAARGEAGALDETPYVAPTAPPAPPAPGAKLAWPVTTVTIVSARLGVASVYQDDGSVVLAPAYEFANADGNTWSVIAVDDNSLDFTS